MLGQSGHVPGVPRPKPRFCATCRPPETRPTPHRVRGAESRGFEQRRQGLFTRELDVALASKEAGDPALEGWTCLDKPCGALEEEVDLNL